MLKKLFFLFFLLVSSVSAFGLTSTEREYLLKKYETLNSYLLRLEGQRAELTLSIQGSKEQLVVLNRQIEELKRQMEILEIQLKDSEESLKILESGLKRIEDEKNLYFGLAIVGGMVSASVMLIFFSKK